MSAWLQRLGEWLLCGLCIAVIALLQLLSMLYALVKLGGAGVGTVFQRVRRRVAAAWRARRAAPP